MSDVHAYLARFFSTKPTFAKACALSVQAVNRLLEHQLIPAPSYIVRDGAIQSHLFGKLPAPDVIESEYFHPDMVGWTRRAVQLQEAVGLHAAQAALKARYEASFLSALAQLDRSLWRLKDTFRDDGSLIQEGYEARCAETWDNFMQGTYGLCVAHPVSELAIARKEVLQEKLTTLTANGARKDYSDAELPELLRTLDEYDHAAMPFSPLDYPLSSRKRLIDDVRTLLRPRLCTSPE
jgi:hypothetical protein